MKSELIYITALTACVIILTISVAETNRKVKELQEINAATEKLFDSWEKADQAHAYKVSSIGKSVTALYSLQSAYMLKLIQTMPYNAERRALVTDILKARAEVDSIATKIDLTEKQYGIIRPRL